MKKDKGTEAQADADIALRKLEEYGERFMAMFEDGDERKGMKASTSGRTAGGAARGKLAVYGTDRKDVSGPSPPAKSKMAKKLNYTAQPTAEQGRAQPAPESLPLVADGSARPKDKRNAGRADEIDAIMRAGKKAKSSQGDGGPSSRAKAGAQQQAQAAAAAAQQAAMAEALRRERKLFMSHKASKVHEAVDASGPARPAVAASADDAGLSPEEFQKLQLEVEKLAISALDKKSAKQAKARMLARVGAKAETGPRTALSIGKGMAKMAAKRKARALEEAIEAGMVQRKGLGKKKRALKAKNRDRGLMEAGPSFKNGILRVKPLKKTRAESGKLRLPKGVL